MIGHRLNISIVNCRVVTKGLLQYGSKAFSELKIVLRLLLGAFGVSAELVLLIILIRNKMRRANIVQS